MTIIAFILGIALGFLICYWPTARASRELKQMLTALADTADLEKTFPVTSLVRRELQFLDQRCQKVEETLAMQKSLLDRAPIGYLHLDIDNQLLWCNQQAIEWLKLDRWQPDQVRLLLELVRSYELDQLIQETRQSQSSQTRAWTFYPANYITAPHGEHQVAYSQSIALKGYSYPLPKGEVGVFIENQQPLVELSRTRERAFSDLTHELRTPLTSISLIAEALHKRSRDPERRWIEQMSREVERLTQLVRDWLEISQLQADSERSLPYQTIDFLVLLTDAWERVTPLAEQKQITLQSSGGESWPRPSIEGDESRLLRVFLNLFDNAIKYSPPRGVIRLQLEEIQDTSQKIWLQIDVIDAGEGFNEADLPYVFDRLFRGDPARARPSEATHDYSTGLGLSIAQQIIQAHGGSIVARNHPETGGGWIQVILPRSDGERRGREKEEFGHHPA
jgi:two-component system phosphate regulon sensor histidine kinase PhoR